MIVFRTYLKISLTDKKINFFKIYKRNSDRIVPLNFDKYVFTVLSMHFVNKILKFLT